MATNIDRTNPRLSSLGSTVGLVTSGGGRSAPSFVYQESTKDGVIEVKNDWRVKISLPEESKLFYNEDEKSRGILAPLKETQGVIFPYTPQITVTYEAQYDNVATTHSNYMNYFYKSSQINAIQITGDFTVQNTSEGQYLMAVIYFLRAATRMFFGKSGNAGNPPIIVFLNGYGSHYFPNVPCIVTSFAHVLPNDVDYVPVPITADVDGDIKSNLITRLPTTSSLSITVNPVYSRLNVFDNYDLNKIARGGLMTGKGFL